MTELLVPNELLGNIESKMMVASGLGEQAAPLMEFTPDEIEAMRIRFAEKGFKVEWLTEAEKESLLEQQFRGRPGRYDFLEKGRGPGMMAVMGLGKVRALVDWCYGTAISLEWEGHKIGGKEGTQGRGLQQAAADVISLVVFGSEKQAYFLTGINQRLAKGLRSTNKNNPQVLEAIDRKFKDVPQPQIPEELASIPPGSLVVLWRYITG